MTQSLTARLFCAFLAAFLTAAPLAAQSAAQPAAAKLRPAMDAGKLKSLLINVPTGSPLRVRTRDGMQVDGKLTQLTNDNIQIQALVNGNIENRTLAFSDISGLKTGVRKTGLAGKLSPVLTIVGLIGTASALTAAIK